MYDCESVSMGVLFDEISFYYTIYAIILEFET